MTNLRFSLLVLMGSLLLCSAANAQDKQYALSNYDVDLTLERSGAYRVAETIRFDFQQGTFSQANRSIPLGRVDSLRDVQVTSLDGAVNTVEHEADGDDYVIRWTYPERRQPATFTLRYTAYGALEAEGGANVIDWQAVGDQWNVPIRDVNVDVSLPFGDLARDSIAAEPSEEAALARTGAGWTASFAHAELAPGDGYRVIVRFPERIAAPAGDDSPPAMIFTGLLLILLGFGIGAGVFATLRGPSADPEAVPEPAQPDLSLPVAAHLANHNSTTGQRRMFSAVLFDLAQRGHVTLRREKKEHFLTSSEIVVVDVHADPVDLSDFEASLLDEIQQHDSLQAFGRSSTGFKGKQVKAVRQGLLDAGWLQSHTGRSNALIATGVILTAIGLALFAVLSGWAAAIGVGLSVGAGLGALMAAGRRYTLTNTGAQRKAEVRAFLNRERTAIESRRSLEPVQAAQQFIDRLPWLILDTEVDKSWIDDLKDTLAESHTTFSLPDWMEDTVGLDEAAASEAVAAFIPIYAVISSTSAATGAGAAAGAAGAGAAGGAGGGGGGAA